MSGLSLQVPLIATRIIATSSWSQTIWITRPWYLSVKMTRLKHKGGNNASSAWNSGTQSAFHVRKTIVGAFPAFAGFLSNLSKDESLYPPRCCRASIPPSTIWVHLSRDVSRRFSERQIEMSTTERTYCRSCTKFILPDQFDGRGAVCPRCSALTCSGCKEYAHQDACSDDPATEETKRLAAEEGWQSCPQCNNMIELGLGCYHITFVRR